MSAPTPAVPPAIIVIDSRVSGFGSSPERILAAVSLKTGKVTISKEGIYKEKYVRSPNTVMVTDSPNNFGDWQLAFDERRDLADVIRNFFAQSRSGKVSYATSGLQKHDPTSVLIARKVDTGGAVWEFDGQSVTNGQVAVLLAVWTATKAMQSHFMASQVDEPETDDEVDEDDPLMPFSVGG